MILKKSLGEILTNMGVVSKQQLGKALERQKEIYGTKTVQERLQRFAMVTKSRKTEDKDTAPMLGQILTDMNLVTREQLQKALGEQVKSLQAYQMLDSKKLGTIMEISSIISSTLNLSEVLAYIMDHVNQLTQSVASTLMLLDDQTGELVFSVPTGPKADELMDIRIPPGKGVAGWVVKHEEPLLVLDVRKDPRFYAEIDKVIGFETKSMVCVPLKTRTKLIGVLEVINKADNTSFTKDDLLLLSVFASEAALAIENARVYTELENRLDDLVKTERSLRESEEKYRILVENANDAIFIAQDGVVKFPNPRAVALSGYSEDALKKIPFADLIHPKDREMAVHRHQERLTGKDFSPIVSFRILPKNKELLWVELSTVRIDWEGRPATLNFIRDITHDKKREAQLQQAQKMEAIGTLAGGIAHDFNNILSAINGFTELAYLNVEEGSTTKKYLTDTLEGCRRAKELVKQILAFSRQAETEKKPIDAVPIVIEALKFMRSSLPSTIEITQQIRPEHGIILGDPVQVHQILINLCTNAGHAMQDNGGILEVAVAEIEIDPDAAKIQPDFAPGPYLQISIRDTGCGMKPEVLERIFDPYFTTKKQGEGTGLGLSVVHGIIKNLEGTLRVKSSPGTGTTFDIFLPIIQMSPDEAVETVGPLLTGRERILCVDDEPAVLNMCNQMLNYLGYRIETQTSSPEALELFRKNPERFDLVMTDMTMPQMTGDRLAAEIMKIRPDMPVILCTGFSHKMTKKQAKQHGIKAFLMKPLVLRDLSSTIRNVLDAEKGGAPDR
jgi:PAS domain S-box-containing protein